MSAPDRTANRLTEIIARHVLERPHAPAVTDSSGTLDWATFAARIEGVAAQFVSLGVRPGSRIALWLPNDRDYLCAIFAAARCGALVAHINTRFGPSEVGDLLDRTNAEILVTSGRAEPVDFLGIFARISPPQVARLRTIICVGGTPSKQGSTWPTVLFDPRGSAPDVSTPGDPCLVFTTGGTTAKPKLVLHTQRSVTEHAERVARVLGMDGPGTAHLGAVPFCGTFGNVSAMSMLAGGGQVVCMKTFDAIQADRLIREHAITHMVGDDRMLGRLAEAAEVSGAYRSIRFYGVGAFSTQLDGFWARGITAGLQPRAIYGSSEVHALFAVALKQGRADDAVAPIDERAEFRIVQDGEGQDGALLIRSPTLFARYLDDDEATYAVKAENGFFATGDLAAPASSGFVFRGRLGDVVRLGGFLVHPLEIESFLQTHEAVAEAQVVAVEKQGRSVIVAFVIPKGGSTFSEGQILDYCRARLAKFKVPARIHSIAEFPTSTGANGPKISKSQLRSIAQLV